VGSGFRLVAGVLFLILASACGGGAEVGPDSVTDAAADVRDSGSPDDGTLADARDAQFPDVPVDVVQEDLQDAWAADDGVESDEDLPDSGEVPIDIGSDDSPPSDVLGRVPGEVVYWRVSPEFRILGPDLIYTTSPSIVVLPNGDYLISFNLFGNSLEPSAEVSGTTYIYRSSDKGATWTCLTPEPMMDMKRGSLFVHDGAVYLWGYTAAPGRIVIRRSDDNGSTWTEPVDDQSGLLTADTYGGTPGNPVFHDGRVWMAVAGKRVMSAPQDSDLLLAASWSGPSLAADTNGGPLGDGLTITEAQIVASPAIGVSVLPKIDGLPFTVVISADGDASVRNPSEWDWASFPGGEKKFGAGYDPVSKRFWALSNPVPQVHANHPEQGPQLIRNTAALLSSRDLRQWDVRQIFLYSPNVDYEAFQYLNFDIDGDDMIIVSRTAFDITPLGLFKPPRGHESNMITFHRIEDFRNAFPTHYLVVADGEVLRYERTGYADAPLGRFTLGSVFDDMMLDAVTGLADGGDGTVLVREERGRVLRFDLSGNFLGVATGSTAVFEPESIYIGQPPEGECTWIRDGDGAWADSGNWYYWGRPDYGMEDAVFGTVGTAPRKVEIDIEYRVRGLRFSGEHGYELAGEGSLYVEAVTGKGQVAVTRGAHKIGVPVRVAGTLDVSIEAGCELYLASGLNMKFSVINISGGGRMPLAGTLDMAGGTLVVDGRGTLSIGPGTVCLISDATLEFKPGAEADMSVGKVYPLISGAANLNATFGTVLLPDPGPGRAWDQTRLYIDGTVKVVGI